MRRRAVRALASHTATAIDNLKQDEDEMLRGMLLLLTVLQSDQFAWRNWRTKTLHSVRGIHVINIAVQHSNQMTCRQD